MGYLPEEWREGRLSYEVKRQHHKWWTQEEHETLRQACEDNLHIEEVAALLPRRSKEAIYHRTHIYGFPALRESKIPNKPYPRRNWPDERIAECRRLIIDEDLNYDEAGALLGCTRNAVASIARQHGFQKKKVARQLQQE